MYRMLLIALIAGGAAVTPASAQVVSKAPTGLLKEIPVGLDKAYPAFQLRGLICYNKPDFLNDPSNPASTRLPRDLPIVLYMQSYAVAEIYEEPTEDAQLKRKRKWYLLADTVPLTTPLKVRDNGFVGWLPEEQVACFANKQGYPEALREAKTPIHRKCMLINTLEEARKVEDLKSQISFADRADGKGQPTLSRALFTIYYIYHETATHFFVGDQPTARSTEVFAGWVEKKRVCQWNTREAVEFNKVDERKRPAVLFNTQEEMQNYLKSDELPSVDDLGPEGKFTPRPLALEQLKAPALNHFQARFPLVSEDGTKQGVEPLGGFKIYKVGVIGDVYSKDLKGGPVMTNQRLEEARREVENMRRQVTTIQIVFAIDATFGMDEYFKAGNDAVKKIMASLQDLQGLGGGGLVPRVEFSVNFYRDRRDMVAQVPSFDGYPFGTGLDAITRLEKTRALLGGDEYDSVYYGICKALEIDPRQNPATLTKGQKSKFTPNATKIFVLIGDDGNDDTDKEYTQDAAFKALVEAGEGQPINFFSVSVGDQTKPRFKKLTEQMRELTGRLAKHQRDQMAKAYAGKLPMEVDTALDKLNGDGLSGTNPQAVVQGIANRFELAKAELLVKERFLRDLEKGETRLPTAGGLPVPVLPTVGGEPVGGYGVVWEKQILESLKEKGLGDLEKARDGIQLFRTGWIVEREPQEPIPNGKPEAPSTIRHAVLVRKDELRILHTVLTVLQQKWDEEQLGKAWMEALKVVSGEIKSVEGNDTATKLLQIHLGVSVRNIGLLHLTFDELQRLKPAELHRLRLDLQMVTYRINDVLENQSATYKIAKDATGREYVKREDPKLRQYWWGEDPTRPELAPRAWIDREYLP